jgi:glucose/mannose transport system substrate-binding protein
LWTGETSWSDPGVTQALNTMKRMLSYTNADHAGLTWDQADDLVISGKAAMTIMGDWTDGDFTAKHFTGYGYVPTPGTQGVYDALADTFGLPKGAKDKPQVLNWLRMIGTAEAQDAFNPVKGAIPANLNAGNAPYDTYLQSAMADWRSNTIVPSLAHGAAASDGWLTSISDSVTVFVTRQDVAATQQALVQSAIDAGVSQ